VTPPPDFTEFLSGTTAAGAGSAITVAAAAPGSIVRALGLAGDSLTVRVPKFDASGDPVWPPSDWDLTKDISITFGPVGSEITLGGYLLVGDNAEAFGVSVPDHSGTGAVVPNLRVLTLMTHLGVRRNGRGGLITVGVRNPVDAEGEVDTGDPDYKTNSELVTELVAAMGLTLIDVPLSIDDFPPPGPLDWGNALAIDELEALLARVGYSAALSLDGAGLTIVRLPIAGEDQTLPTAIDDAAEPYELGEHRSIRATKIVVSSGRTRTIIISEHDFEDFEWVAFDDRSLTWGNAADWASLYPSEIGPDDIDAYRAGPPRDDRGRRQWSRLYGAIGLADNAMWKRKRRMVPLPIQVDDGEDGIVKGAAVVYGRGVVAMGANQLRNDPYEADGIKRFEGAKVHSPDGVIELPSGVEWVKFTGQEYGTREHAAALAAGDMVVRFAHEAYEEDRLTNYYWRGFTVAVVDGEVELTPITDEELLNAAIDDPDTLKLNVPFLQRVLDWPLTETDPVAVTENKDTLDAIAEQLARVRAAGALAKSGAVELRGLQEIEPGAYGGAASMVRWDLDNDRTVIDINMHEAPEAWWDMRELRANRSLASGLGRFSPPASSAAMSDVRGGSTPGEAFVAGVGGGAQSATSSATRGAEDRVSGQGPIALPGVELRRQPEQVLWVRITAATSVATNKWRYSWESVALSDTPLEVSVAGAARTHATDGYAYNGMEAPNDGSGVEGNSVDRDNLPGGFAMQPIATGVLKRIYGPYGGETRYWLIDGVPNSDDGECS
jgi:hypothetical protein